MSINLYWPEYFQIGSSQGSASVHIHYGWLSIHITLATHNEYIRKGRKGCLRSIIWILLLKQFILLRAIWISVCPFDRNRECRFSNQNNFSSLWHELTNNRFLWICRRLSTRYIMDPSWKNTPLWIILYLIPKVFDLNQYFEPDHNTYEPDHNIDQKISQLVYQRALLVLLYYFDLSKRSGKCRRRILIHIICYRHNLEHEFSKTHDWLTMNKPTLNV